MYITSYQTGAVIVANVEKYEAESKRENMMDQRRMLPSDKVGLYRITK